MIVFCSLRSADIQFDPFKSLLDDVESAVAEPVVVSRKNGSHFSGQFAGHIESGFIMSQSVGIDGKVEVEFTWEEIDSVSFAGETILGSGVDLFETGDYQTTIAVLSPFYQQRSPFLRVLPDDMIEPFRVLANCYLETGDATAALGIIRGLKPWIDEEMMVRDLEKIELLCYLLLELDEEAVVLARQQIEGANDPSSAALAWIALSFHHLNSARYREAWLSAVHPILFDRRTDSIDLPDAYLVAMIATLKLNRPDLSMKYHQEFLARKMELVSKSYQKEWVEFIENVDWIRLAEKREEMEQFTDIESRITPSTTIDPTHVPLLKIPLSN